MSSDGYGARGRFYYDTKTGKFKRVREKKKVRVHGVVGDEVDPFISHAAPGGKQFSSRSQYRRHLKAMGFRERGEAPRDNTLSELREREEREERERREDIEKSYFDIKYDRVEFSDQEKEAHLREERACRREGLPTKIKSPY